MCYIAWKVKQCSLEKVGVLRVEDMVPPNNYLFLSLQGYSGSSSLELFELIALNPK